MPAEFNFSFHFLTIFVFPPNYVSINWIWDHAENHFQQLMSFQKIFFFFVLCFLQGIYIGFSELFTYYHEMKHRSITEFRLKKRCWKNLEWNIWLISFNYSSSSWDWVLLSWDLYIYNAKSNFFMGPFKSQVGKNTSTLKIQIVYICDEFIWTSI